MARKMKSMDGNTAAAHVSYAFTVHGLHLSCHVYILLFSYNMLKG